MTKRPTQKQQEFPIRLSSQSASGGAYTLAAVLPTVLSLLFLIVVTSLGLTKNKGYENKDWYLYASYLIAPLSFAIVAVLFYKKTDAKPSETFSLGQGKYYLVALLLQFGLFSLSELNSLFLKGLNALFGYQNAPIALPNVMGWGIVGVILVVAVLPAIAEELFFRGILFRGLKEYGETFAVLVCGALFSLYHQNPAQTAYQFCCGAAFALVAIKSGSILPTILSHFVNNAAIILLFRFGLAEFSTAFKIPFLICSAACLIGSLLYLILFDKKPVAQGDRPAKKAFFLYAAAGMAIFAISWIVTLCSGI